MAVKLTTAKQSVQENGLKVLVHGLSGTGKTKLIESIVAAIGDPSKVCIISGEKGLLSLASGPAADCPVIEINNLADLDQAYAIVSGEQGKDFHWVALDSISDIAEVCLADEKAIKNDPRQAYGMTQDKVFMRIRKFRDLPGKNVYFIAKTKREKNESEGTNLYQPMMPGTNLSQGISYFFDEVFFLRVVSDGKGGTQRALQTGRDLENEAKDRSGKLEMYEPADLGHIHRKILGAAA